MSEYETTTDDFESVSDTPDDGVLNQPTDLLESGYDVGRLIAYALKSAKPAREGEYKQLVDRYKYDDVFGGIVDKVLEGMGLQVLNETTHALRGGLVLGCLGQSSPFAPNIDSHARGLSREQRLALGIIHLGAMSFFYPQIDENEDDDDYRSRAGTPSEIAADIRQVCETLATREQRDHEFQGGPPAHIRQAFEAFLALPPAPARGGFLTKSSQVGLVNHALNELYKNNFLGTDGGDGINTRFVSLPKYRIYVRRLAAHKAAQLIRGARQKVMDAEERQSKTKTQTEGGPNHV